MAGRRLTRDEIRKRAYVHGRSMSWIMLIESEAAARQAAATARRTLVNSGVPDHERLVDVYEETTQYPGTWSIEIHYPFTSSDRSASDLSRAALDAAFAVVRLVRAYTLPGR